MASQVNDQLHFLLIPLLSQSHIIPLTDFAKLLAKRGLIVSVITTPRNFMRYRATLDHAVNSGLKIRMIPLEFPGREAGLPPGCENMDSLISMDLARQFFQACEMLKAPLEKLIQELNPKPSCIVSSNALPWTQQLADKFNIPRYVFETISCFSLLCSHILSENEIQEREISDSKTFLVPNIPHKIEFTKAQLPESSRKSSDNNLKKIIDDMKKAQTSARATLVNSFVGLEPDYVDGYKKVRKRIWPIGPVSNATEKSSRGDKASIDEQCCISWLGLKKPKSVIYVCFGSLCRISTEQIKEIGLGLEDSNRAFIWVIRGLDSSEEVEKWLQEEGFERRVEGRGLIVKGWAPQVLILSHPSVGGFMTHCGWNSTLEGVSAGVPMITWPMFAEQFYNEKFIVKVLEIGVRVGVELGARPGEKNKVVVKADRVKEAIEKFMEGGEEGEERRSRARKLGEMARDALEEGGSSYMNITLLIQDAIQQLSIDC